MDADQLGCLRKVSRRTWLKAGFLGGVGLSLADFLALADTGRTNRPRADGCIFIHLKGGPSHLDTMDMKPEAPAAERGAFGSIATRLAGLRVCEHLPRFAQAADQFCLVRGISHSAGAHPQADEYIFTGNRPSAAVKYPSLGSVLARERPSRADIPGFVAVPISEMGPGFLGVAYAPFKTTAVPRRGQPFQVRGLALGAGVTVEQVQERTRLLQDLDTRFQALEKNNALLEGMDRFGRTATEMILSAHARRAFDVSREAAPISRLFADNDFSQSLLLACRLVEFGVRFVTVSFGGWDTHLDNFNGLRNRLLPPFDAGISALVEGLRQKGLLARTLVACLGEFGRTPTINPQVGRDHWPRAGWALFAGGGVRTGQLLGGTDSKGHGPDNDTRIAPDDLAASIYDALGIDPRREYHTPNGRPVTLVPQGNVIPGLFS
jgi:uncharacterized protein (DUF1501 family)